MRAENLQLTEERDSLKRTTTSLAKDNQEAEKHTKCKWYNNQLLTLLLTTSLKNETSSWTSLSVSWKTYDVDLESHSNAYKISRTTLTPSSGSSQRRNSNKDSVQHQS